MTERFVLFSQPTYLIINYFHIGGTIFLPHSNNLNLIFMHFAYGLFAFKQTFGEQNGLVLYWYCFLDNERWYDYTQRVFPIVNKLLKILTCRRNNTGEQINGGENRLTAEYSLYSSTNWTFKLQENLMAGILMAYWKAQMRCF